MFYVLGQKATALTMKNMKVLKEDPHCLGYEDRSFAFLHALRGYLACTVLHHEGPEGNSDTASGTETEVSTFS